MTVELLLCLFLLFKRPFSLLFSLPACQSRFETTPVAKDTAVQHIYTHGLISFSLSLLVNRVCFDKKGKKPQFSVVAIHTVHTVETARRHTRSIS